MINPAAIQTIKSLKVWEDNFWGADGAFASILSRRRRALLLRPLRNEKNNENDAGHASCKPCIPKTPVIVNSGPTPS